MKTKSFSSFIPPKPWRRGILSSFFFLLFLVGAGCAPTSIIQVPPTVTPPVTTPPITTPPTDSTASWQTYADSIRGFSLKYPGDQAIDITTDPVMLPPAVGNKQRQLKIDVSSKDKTPLDAQGCLVWGVPAVSKTNLTINGQSFCEMVVDEGAAGSTYRTYHYTTFIDQVIDIQTTIRFPTSVRIYGGCENDADQSKQQCIDLAFDEARDTNLFNQIINTFKHNLSP